VSSKHLDWDFVTATRLDDIYREIELIRRNIIFLVVLLSCLLAFIVLISAKRLYHPLYRLIERMRKREPVDGDKQANAVIGELEYLEQNVSRSYEQQRRLSLKLEESLPAYKEKFIMQLCRGHSFTMEELAEKLGYFGINIDIQGLYVLIIAIDKTEYTADTLHDQNVDKLMIVDFIQKRIPTRTKRVISEIEENKIVVLMNAEKAELSLLIDLFQIVKTGLKKLLYVTATVGGGRFCDSIGEVSRGFAEAEEALNYRISLGENEIIYIEDVRPHSITTVSYIKEREDYLIRCIKGVERDKALEALREIFAEIRGHHGAIYYEQIIQSFVRLMSKIIDAAHEMGADPQMLFSDQANVYNDLLKMHNIDEVAAWFADLIDRAFLYMRDGYISRNRKTVEEIVTILNQDCRNVTLYSVAERVGLTPNYVSRIFKQLTGKNFNAYLTDIRMEKGKQLLSETHLRVKDISEQIGYSNSYYFIRLFREHTGTTPGAFRNASSEHTN